MLSERPVSGTHEVVASVHNAAQSSAPLLTQDKNALNGTRVTKCHLNNAQTLSFAGATRFHRASQVPGR